MCPANCSGHGVCDCGQCMCDIGWGTEDCSCSLMPCPNDCNERGNCSCSVCECEEPYRGEDCMCDSTATCGACVNGLCCTADKLGVGDCTSDKCGLCLCNPGWEGETCDCSQAPCPGGCYDHGSMWLMAMCVTSRLHLWCVSV